MTDNEALYLYRLTQAAETLDDIQRMIVDNYSPRSIINRSYYVMFYSILALCIKAETNIKSSKHSGIISLFDKEFINKGIFEKKYSKMLHIIFDLRHESDYKELSDATVEDARDCVNMAGEFYQAINDYIV